MKWLFCGWILKRTRQNKKQQLNQSQENQLNRQKVGEKSGEIQKRTQEIYLVISYFCQKF